MKPLEQVQLLDQPAASYADRGAATGYLPLCQARHPGGAWVLPASDITPSACACWTWGAGHGEQLLQ